MKNDKKTKSFEVKGTVQIGRKNQAFTKNVAAYNAAHATEKTLTLFGSKNNVTRRQITIQSAAEAKEKKGA
jgi:ribosomal protein L20A (L18A)